MEDVFEIFKLTIPALIVFAVVFFMLKQFFTRESKLRTEEIKIQARKDYVPLKIQAHERSVLYLERIDPNNLIMRVHRQGMSARYLHTEMLKAIREEYIHNMAQQIYISSKGWKALKQAKEETVKILNMAMNNMEDTASGMELSSVIFDIVGRLDKQPTEIAIEQLRKDFQRSMV